MAAAPGLVDLSYSFDGISEDELYDRFQSDVDVAVSWVARRYRLSRAEAADLRGDLWVRLLSEGRRALALYAGRGKLRNYLTTVARNLIRDAWIRESGKWRPSVAARNAGPLAVELERLMCRDALSYEEATEFLTTRHQVARSVIEDLRSKIRLTAPRRLVADIDIEDALPSNGAADSRVVQHEHANRASRATRALAEALAQLSDEERALLGAKFLHRRTIADIAREWNTEQKPLYRALERTLLRLRHLLRVRGVTDTMVLDITGHDPVHITGLLQSAPRAWTFEHTA